MPKNLKSLPLKSEKVETILNKINRPAIAIHYQSSLTVVDNRVLPVQKKFQENGVTAIIEINENNELIVNFLVPEDTVVQKNTIVTVEVPRLVNEKDSKFKGLPLRISLTLLGMAFSLGLLYYRNKNKKK
jgi:hypothetical protein